MEVGLDPRASIGARAFGRLSPRGREALALGATLALAVGVLFPLVALGWLPPGVDTDSFYAPFGVFLHERLAAGDLPLWQPYAFSGQPFFADPQSGVFYPPALIAYGLLEPPDALAALAAFHYLLATAATYAFVRLCGASRTGSAYAAIAFGVSGTLIARIQALGLLSGAAWIPVCLAAAQYVVVTRGRPGPAPVLLALAICGQVLTGSQQLTAATAASVLLWLLLRLGPRGALIAVGSAAGAVLLAAVAVLPRLQMLSLSTVPNGVEDAVGVGRFTRADLRALLGDFGTIRWTEVTTMYAGALTPALALWAVLRRRREGSPALVALFALAMVWATGLVGWVLGPLPLLSGIAAHQAVRALPIAVFAMAALAGLAIGSGRRPPRVVPIAVIAIALAVVASSGHLFEWEYLVPLAASLGALMVWRRRMLPAGIAVALLLGVLAADLAQHGYTQQNPNQKAADWQPAEAIYSAPPPSAAYLLERQQVETPFRIAALGRELLEHQLGNLRRTRFRSMLMNMAGTRYGLEDVAGYNPLHLKSYSRYMARSNGEPVERHWEFALRAGTPELRALGVRYYVSTWQDEPPGMTRVYDDQDLVIVRDDNALPLARVESPGSEPVEAHIAVRDPDRVVIETPADSPGGRLVLADVQYSGWRVQVDGRSAPALTEDGIMRAVDVSPGAHRVEWTFSPPRLRLGLIVSALTALLLAGAAIVPVVRRRRARAASAPGAHW